MIHVPPSDEFPKKYSHCELTKKKNSVRRNEKETIEEARYELTLRTAWNAS